MAIDRDWLVVLTSDELGQGPTDLGVKLTGLWLKCLSEAETLPAKVLFLNSAVFLTTEGTPHRDVLRGLEERGTELVSCITCLTYHDRMERIVVGSAGDMKGTVADMSTFSKVTTM